MESSHNANASHTSWPVIESKLNGFADCLERESEFASGRLKLRINRVLLLLKSKPQREEVLANRDALAVVLPLLIHDDEDISIESAVRKGVQRIACSDVYRRNWLQLFWYPGLVLIIAFFVCVLLSFTAAPSFESILEQFGFRTQDPRFPLSTRFSLGVASFLRVLWLPISMVLLLAAISLGWMNHSGRKNNSSGLGWWDDRNVSVRGALAIWSDHLASLLQVGVSQTDAFELASRDAPKRSLRQLSEVLAERDKVSDENTLRPYFPLQKYAMLDHALKLKASPAKVATLREVSIYYRNRDRYISTWWMSWLSLAMLWLTGAMVFVIFQSIFSPLNFIVRDITGAVSGVVSGIGN